MSRADRLLERLAERELDQLLVTNLTNVRWLTGFTGSNAAAAIGPDTCRFITDFRYLTQSAEQVDEAWTHEIAQELLKAYAEGVAKVGGDRELRVGFDDDDLSVKQHAKLRDLLPGQVELV